MRVLTPSGYRDLADMAVGDELRYFDIDTGEPKVNTLLGVERYTPERFRYYEQDEDGNNLGELIVPPFPVYVINGVHRLFRDQSIWTSPTTVKHASALEIGDTIYDDADQDVVVTSIEVEEGTEWQRFHVSGDASYIADGLTLHNASRFWVGGTGNWTASTTTNWSGTSGGGGGSSVPTSSDDVTTDSASNATAYTITVTVAVNCADLTIGNPLSGAVTVATSGGNVGIKGSFTRASGSLWNVGTTTYTSVSTGKTITSNGVTGGAHTFNGVGGGWTLQDAFVAGFSAAITLTSGSLDTNGMAVNAGSFASNNSNTRTLTLGASVVTATGSAGWVVAATGLTFDAGTSAITLNSSSNLTFTGAGLTYYDVSFTGNGGISTISDANTFRNLSRTVSSATTGVLALGANQTVTGTFTAGNSAVANVRVQIQSDIVGTQRTITAAAVSLVQADFRDIVGAGAATWTGTNLGDSGGNSNITFATPKTVYGVFGAANKSWNSVSIWALTSGGAGATANYPLPQDTLRIDANSVTAASVTVTMNAPRLASNVDFTGVLNSPIFNVTVAGGVVHFGSLTLVSGMTWSGTTGFTFRNRSAATLTSAGKTFPAGLTIDGPNGVVTATDATAVTGAFTVNDAIGARFIAGANTVTYTTMSGWVFYGASAVTEADDTNSAAGTVAITAGESVTDGGDTNGAADTNAIVASLATTDANDTQASSAFLQNFGGVPVIRYLLANNSVILTWVPASRIVAGDLPLNTVLPAISVKEIDSQPRLTVAMNEPNRMHTERVQVSVLFKGPQGTPAGIGLPGVKRVLALLLAACPHTHGTVNGVNVVSILPDGEGPDLQDVATSLYSGSRDFLVKYKS